MVPEENTTATTYFNTTNLYASGKPWDEISIEEGDKPLYVLLFADEEEWNAFYPLPYGEWYWYATFQIERGDEALIHYFGVDIRILSFGSWVSDNDVLTMEGLWDNLCSQTEHYVGTLFPSPFWGENCRVDAIIGITAQATQWDPYPIAGLAPGPDLIDQGKSIILLKWWHSYWADDNLVQHEISHLFYPNDHYATCCVMANHTHYQSFIWEDGLFSVFADIPCLCTSYTWHTTCHSIINNYNTMYLDEIFPYMLIVRHGFPDNPKGRIFAAGVHPSEMPFEVRVSVISPYPGYKFDYWLIDGNQKVYTTSLTILVDKKHAVAAYFIETNGSGSGGARSRSLTHCLY